MFARLGALLGLVLLVGSCSTVGVTSPYAKLGTKEVYEYGTFCGPRLPKSAYPLGSVERSNEFARLSPQDSIDAACRIHDICFNLYGEDNFFCDEAILGYLMPGVGPQSNREISREEASLLQFPEWNWSSSAEAVDYRISSQCTLLAKEIFNGIYMKTRSKNGFNAAINVSASIMMGAGHVLASPMRVLDRHVTGYPERPGLCKMTTSAKNFSEQEAAFNFMAAAAASDCGCYPQWIEGSFYLYGIDCTPSCRTASLSNALSVVGFVMGEDVTAQLSKSRAYRRLYDDGLYRRPH